MASSTTSKLADRIDDYVEPLATKTQKRLERMGEFSDAALERIVFEGQRVSIQNPPILKAAVDKSKAMVESGVYDELLENYEEEKTHPEMYRKAVEQIGSDLSKRTPWPTADALFQCVYELVDKSPSTMLGSMYASESVALFESQALLDVGKELIKRRGVGTKGRNLVAFHELHLSGVEQEHKDGLGQYLDSTKSEGGAAVDQDDVWEGAVKTVDAIDAW